MAKKFGFFNSINGDRKYLASDIAEAFDIGVTTGLKAEEGNLQVVPSENMQIKILPGGAMIFGRYYLNDEDEIINLDTADGELNRIDRVVLRYDKYERSIKTVVIKGTLALNPTAPAPLRTSEQFDLVLADIYVAKATTIITESNITDMRESELCGYIGVKGAVSQLDFDAHLADKTKYFIFRRTRNQTIYNDGWQTIGWNTSSNQNGADFCTLNADGTITFTQSGIYEIQISLMWEGKFQSVILPTSQNNIGASFETQNIFVSCFKEYAAGEIWGGRVTQSSGTAKNILSNTRTTMYIRQVVKL